MSSFAQGIGAVPKFRDLFCAQVILNINPKLDWHKKDIADRLTSPKVGMRPNYIKYKR